MVATAPEHPGSPESTADRSIWRRRLHEATDLDLPKGADVQERLSVGDPATEILRLAADQNADLVVIGGHRGNPPGCVMNALVIRSRCPVLAVRVSR